MSSLFLSSIFLFVFSVDSILIENKITIPTEINELNEYVEKEVATFQETCTNLTKQRTEQLELLLVQNEIVIKQFIDKRNALLMDASIGSIESKNICDNITRTEFSWVLMRFPLEFEVNCSDSISYVWNTGLEHFDNYMDHVFWLSDEIKKSCNGTHQNCEKVKNENETFLECLHQKQEKNKILIKFLHEKMNALLNLRQSRLENFDNDFPLCLKEMKQHLENNFATVVNKFLQCVTENETKTKNAKTN